MVKALYLILMRVYNVFCNPLAPSLFGKFINVITPALLFMPYVSFMFCGYNFIGFTYRINAALALKSQYRCRYEELIQKMNSLNGAGELTLPEMFEKGYLFDSSHNFSFGRDYFDLNKIEDLIDPSLLSSSWIYFGAFIFIILVLFSLWVGLGWLVPLFFRLSPIRVNSFFKNFSPVLFSFTLILYGNHWLAIRLLQEDALKMAEAFTRLKYLEEVLSETAASLGGTTFNLTSFFLFFVVNIAFVVLRPDLSKILDLLFDYYHREYLAEEDLPGYTEGKDQVLDDFKDNHLIANYWSIPKQVSFIEELQNEVLQLALQQDTNLALSPLFSILG